LLLLYVVNLFWNLLIQLNWVKNVALAYFSSRMIQCVCVDLHRNLNCPVSKIKLVHARKPDRILELRVAKPGLDDAA
jgi:hypothetical protein